MGATAPLTAAAAALVFSLAAAPADAQSRDRRERFRHDGRLSDEAGTRSTRRPAEAPTGFDNLTNGYLAAGPGLRDARRGQRRRAPLVQRQPLRLRGGRRRSTTGSAPTYNAQSCRECHQNVVTGGASQVAEHRTGRLERRRLLRVARRLADPFARDGRRRSSSASPSRTTSAPSASRRTRSARASSRRSRTAPCSRCATRSPPRCAAAPSWCPCSRATAAARIGRFGWKSQHASLESFAADAYLNEMGITSPLLPEENTSSGRFVGFGSRYDPVPDPEDDGVDVVAFADFMRSTKAPPARPHHRRACAPASSSSATSAAPSATSASITTAPRARHQRRRLRGAGRARRQGHPSLQRLPAARRRHRRRHSRAPDARARRRRRTRCAPRRSGGCAPATA